MTPADPRSVESLAVELVEALDGDPNECDVRQTPIWRDLVGAVRRDRGARRELPAEGSAAACALETPADERPVGTELSDATIVGIATVLEAVRSLTERTDTADAAQLASDRAYVRTLLVAYTHTIDELREAAARVCSARGWSPPEIAARP